MRQLLANIYSQVADVGLQGLLGLAPAHTFSGQAENDVLTYLPDQLLQAAADRRLMYPQDRPDPGQGQIIEKIVRQDAAILRR